MVTEFRTGGAQVVIPGVRIVQGGGGAGANWWQVTGQTCIAAYAPKGALSLADSYRNLTGNATYDAAPGVAPTFDTATGWQFDGTQHLTTAIFITFPSSAIVRFSDLPATPAGMDLFGAYDGTRSFRITPGDGNLSRIRISTNGPYDHTYQIVGVVAGNATHAFFNGVSVGALAGGMSGVMTRALYIGARNNNGTTAVRLTGKIQALAIYSTTLGVSDVAALSSRMSLL